MIAVVYSGSKSAFWRISKQDHTAVQCTIPGINPFFNDQKQILHLLNNEITLINYAEQIKKIYVFAEGASHIDAQSLLEETLQIFFKNSKIIVKNDLFGAAIAACEHKNGIVCILGSGANCAYFDGKKLEKNCFGLGYLLGDEGSANYLGKMLLKNYLEDKLPKDLKHIFENKYHLDRALILERIYKKPNPQNYLSHFFDFYVENKKHQFIQCQIDLAFEKYFSIYLIPTLKLHPNEDVHFVGTVAGTFEENIHLIAEKHNINITSIKREPINNLLAYYSN